MKLTLISFATLIFTIILFSCNQNKTTEKRENDSTHIHKENPTHDQYTWLNPNDFTPFTFINAATKGVRADTLFGTFTMTDNFPINWVKAENIDTLISLIHSTKKCNCFLNPLSSSIPFNDYAEVGGFARLLVQSYMEKKKLDLGLYYCPKVDQSENEKLINWWKNEKKSLTQ